MTTSGASTRLEPQFELSRSVLLSIMYVWGPWLFKINPSVVNIDLHAFMNMHGGNQFS